MSEDFLVGKIIFDKAIFTQIEDLSKKSIEHERDKELLRFIKKLETATTVVFRKYEDGKYTLEYNYTSPEGLKSSSYNILDLKL